MGDRSRRPGDLRAHAGRKGHDAMTDDLESRRSESWALDASSRLWIDSAALYLETLREGLLGAPAHGDPCRWDWGVTIQTLRDAEQRHERMQKLADSLTPEQKAALWGATDEWAAKLRRFVR